jgi:hypothetical protein
MMFCQAFIVALAMANISCPSPDKVSVSKACWKFQQWELNNTKLRNAETNKLNEYCGHIPPWIPGQ